MILIEKTEILGWESAIRGMRNPMNSWDRSDSGICDDIKCSACQHRSDRDPNAGCAYYYDRTYMVGPNDADLMRKLAKAGSVDAKFRRMIVVYADITAPLYWWKEFDTYKVGTVANSCSTMHKVLDKEFELDDFSHDHLTGQSLDVLFYILQMLNAYRAAYLAVNSKPMSDGSKLSEKAASKLKKDIWWQIIQLLPSSYNQKRTVMLNYEVLSNIYKSRHDHKLDEWRELCKWIESLPYREIITVNYTEK